MPDPHLSAQQRRYVAERAGFCCEYCLSQVKYSPDPFTIDHVDPRARGGTNDLNNLAFACMGCNGRKSTRNLASDPATGQVVELYHPRRHHWHNHFAWDAEFALLIGLTPTGRATIELLQLNRSGVVHLRRLLRTIHKHPPQG
jgi:hypothetical protein